MNKHEWDCRIFDRSQSTLFSGRCQVKLLYFTGLLFVSPKKSNCYIFHGFLLVCMFSRPLPNQTAVFSFCHCEPKVHCFLRIAKSNCCIFQVFLPMWALGMVAGLSLCTLRAPQPLHPFLGVFLLPLSSLCMHPSRVIPFPPPSVCQKIRRSVSRGCHGLQWCWSKSPESPL